MSLYHLDPRDAEERECPDCKAQRDRAQLASGTPLWCPTCNEHGATGRLPAREPDVGVASVTCCGRSFDLRWQWKPSSHHGFPLLGGPEVWEHWHHLARRGVLATVHGGPATYGHTTIYVRHDWLNTIRAARRAHGVES